MKLENNFTIDAPVEKAWEALNTPETVAPCFPGATLTNYEGDSFTGTVKIKLGPISMTYKGKGTYVNRDEAAHEVIIDASGRDSRGNGTATAKVTASLAADGPDRTTVSMVTDMTITGKPAQFGRGVIADVADKIIGQFSACVARKLAPGAEGAESTAESAAAASSAASSASATAGSAASAPASGVGGTSSTAAVPPAAAPAATPAATAAKAVSERSATNGTGVGAATDTAPAATNTAPAASAAAAVEAGAAALGTSGSGTPASGASGTSAVRPPASTTIPTQATHASTPPRATPMTPVRSEVDAIDLFDTAGAPVLKRLVPVAGGALFLVLVILLVRRLRAG